MLQRLSASVGPCAYCSNPRHSVDFCRADGRDQFLDSLDPKAVHYAPAETPLCGLTTQRAAATDDPALVQGCAECLSLAAEDLADYNEYSGRCLHCGAHITAQGGTAWRRAVRRPCPYCGRPGW